MRLFIAAELPDEIAEALAETSAGLRSAVKGRYVAPDSFHITLAFLGETDPALVDAIARICDGACAEHEAFELALGELGSFGRRHRAVLWQGFADTAELDALAASVRTGLADGGIGFEGGKYVGHITLMRNADLESGELPMPALARGRIDTVSLFSSDLSGPRPVYTVLHQAKLRS